MAETKQYNKVIYGGNVLIDLTADTVTADQLHKGITAHSKSGEIITGTNTFDADTSDATAAASEVLSGKTAYVSGKKVTGTMKNNGAIAETIATKDQEITIPIGFHDGSGKVSIDETEQGKLIPANVREGITVLGVTGTMSGSEDMKPEAKDVTPSTTAQTITPADGFNCISQVNVAAIPYTESENAAGGLTATIAG